MCSRIILTWRMAILLGPLPRVRGQLEGRVPQSHALEPVGGEVLVAGARDLGRKLHAVHRGPRRRPRARDVRQVVAAAAERHHAGRQLEEPRHDLGEALHRPREVGQRVRPVRVDPELEHDHVGLEGAQERRHHCLERGLVHRVVRIGLERQVDRVAEPLALAHLLDEARAGKEPVAALVARDRQHARIAVEGELDAVAVMRVDVHVGDLPVAAAQLHDGQHRVVDVAEARGALRHGVVQPAGEVEGARRPRCRGRAGRPASSLRPRARPPPRGPGRSDCRPAPSP